MPRTRNYSWVFEKVYLVSGHRGNLWCQARGSSRALTVYRQIQPKTPKGMKLFVLQSRDRLSDLRHGAEFWMRMPDGKSLNFFVEKRLDMVYTAELPLQGEPGYDRWYGT